MTPRPDDAADEPAKAYCVYLLRDTGRGAEDDGVFYVGKGTGARSRDHELNADDGDNPKSALIKDIQSVGGAVGIEYLEVDASIHMSEGTHSPRNHCSSSGAG